MSKKIIIDENMKDFFEIKSALAQNGITITVFSREDFWYPNETCEEKIFRYQNAINYLLKMKKYALIKDHKIIKYLNKQDIRNDIQYYLESCKKNAINALSEDSTNNHIVDPLGNHILDITNIHIEISEINDWILNELNKNPTELYQLSSRRFEELIAEIFIRKGYSVELTSATRDGGKDIYAARKDDMGSFLYVVECKKYKPTHKVGVNVLRDLYGVLSKERATYGIAVTTSYFSKPAKEFQQDLQFQMSLKDFDSIKQWLCDVT